VKSCFGKFSQLQKERLTMDSSNDPVPDSIIQLQQQFEDFRSTHVGRTKLPDALWEAAVEQAHQ